jgi:2-polyprenyl-6-hydroxyphenyl methylase/3-demethylubiquinone-9 3-methyltransferase
MQSVEKKGDRFAFGKNWSLFLENVDERTIEVAQASIARMTGLQDLSGKRFLDIGSGSGLFSLAAHRMGAAVTSFDYDTDSVRCTETLRGRFGKDAASWQVMQGSVLDADFMASLGAFDFVYSWGVLHHTGSMCRAIDFAAAAVQPGGLLFIALYNDQGWRSAKWLRIKQLYNRLPAALRPLLVLSVVLPYELRSLAAHLVRFMPMTYVRTWTHYGDGMGRGMNKWRDWIDWIGGLPFEVATPDMVIDVLRPRGFALQKLVTRLGGWGCNEFVFRRSLRVED